MTQQERDDLIDRLTSQEPERLEALDVHDLLGDLEDAMEREIDLARCDAVMADLKSKGVL
jgi:hypothetical protein